MTTINKYSPCCIDYKPPFDKEEGVTVKLNIGNREGKIRMMTGSSVEEVLYTIKASENKVALISPQTELSRSSLELPRIKCKTQVGQVD